jgi:hypothetical protein
MTREQNLALVEFASSVPRGMRLEPTTDPSPAGIPQETAHHRPTFIALGQLALRDL